MENHSHQEPLNPEPLSRFVILAGISGGLGESRGRKPGEGETIYHFVSHLFGCLLPFHHLIKIPFQIPATTGHKREFLVRHYGCRKAHPHPKLVPILKYQISVYPNPQRSGAPCLNGFVSFVYFPINLHPQTNPPTRPCFNVYPTSCAGPQ